MAFSILLIVVEFTLVAFILLRDYAPTFALAMFGSVVVYIVVTFLTEGMDFRHFMNRLDSEANTQAFDSLINFEMVKYFGNERMELERYDGTLSDWEHWAVDQTSMSLLNFGQGAVIALGVTLVMYLAVAGVAAGDISIGDLVLLNAFMLQLFIPLGFLGIVYRQIKYSLADMDLISLLERELEITDKTDASRCRSTAGRSASSPSSLPTSLNASCTVRPRGAGRSKVAVAGHSGAGKSTLARLIYRFYDINAGRITIDGQDVRDVTQDSLRGGRHRAGTVLFNQTIRYNIA